MSVNFATFPKSQPTVTVIKQTVEVFQEHYAKISSLQGMSLSSNEVLAEVRSSLEKTGYQVEKDKSASGKLKVPVLFGLNGVPEKTFDADAFHQDFGVVLEVEAGRAVTNYQFLKDLFQACMMHDARYLVIAVRNVYRGNKDFETVVNFFETMYASARISLPLEAITIIGY